MQDGTIDPNRLRILGVDGRRSIIATSPCSTRFHTGRADEWTEVLFRMLYDNPAHREMMDLEGLKAWLPGRITGYHGARPTRFENPGSSPRSEL